MRVSHMLHIRVPFAVVAVVVGLVVAVVIVVSVVVICIVYLPFKAAL